MPAQRPVLRIAAALGGWLVASVAAAAPELPSGAAIADEAGKIMAFTHAQGMAIAVVDHGRVVSADAWGVRNAKGDPLTKDTVMYGASLTKTVFAYTVMQLVDQGRLKLDTPLADDLDKPLPDYPPDATFPDKYGPYKDLADDPRWQQDHAAHVPDALDRLRQLLVHRAGPEAAHPLRARHALQLFRRRDDPAAVRHRARPRGARAGRRHRHLAQADFDRLGMTRTKLTWRNGEDANVADGWNDKGEPQPHDKRSKIRMAGSMNTTIADLSKFAAALVRGDGLSAASRAEMTRPSLHITTAHQFPDFGADAARRPAAQGPERRPGRRRVRRPAGPRLLQGRPRRPDRQHAGLPGARASAAC